jgi:hypothetical protein
MLSPPIYLRVEIEDNDERLRILQFVIETEQVVLGHPPAVMPSRFQPGDRQQVRLRLAQSAVPRPPLLSLGQPSFPPYNRANSGARAAS